jgi:hypothetical protein
VLATLSAAGNVTVEPLVARCRERSLQSMVALPLASILTLDTVTLRLPSGYGAITRARGVEARCSCRCC